MPLRNGDIIGGYKIIAPLGQGGMATVFKAYHERLNRYVAIKMIHQAYLEDPNYLVRFQREAQIIAALEHPHIVPVFDFSEYEGEPYLVMKLIEGSTLKALLNEGLLPPDDILTIITPTASALDYAHSRGVLHRDIKPSNIILDKQAVPYLSDFGLARLSISGATTISQDVMIGTPFYMSPEQALGKGEIDHRADLYSFGVVLYECFVGRVPFNEGTPYAIINDHVARELPLPRSFNPDVSPQIEMVLLRALAKEPDDRYQSATALVEAVQDAVASDSTPRRSSSILKPLAAASGVETPAVAFTPTRPAAPANATKAKAAKPIPAPPPKARRIHAIDVALVGIAVLLLVVLVAFVVARSRNAVVTATPQPTGIAQVAATQVAKTQAAVNSSTRPPQPTDSDQAAPTSIPSVPTVPTIRAQSQQPFPPDPPLVPTIPVPDMSEDQARRDIQNNPNNLGAYLALVRAQLAANDDEGARLTLGQGASLARDRVTYHMTAAKIAAAIGRYDAAFLIYANLLIDAKNEPSYFAIRAEAGEYLYRAPTLIGRLTLERIQILNDDLQQGTSALVSAMLAHTFLINDLPRLAEISLNAALREDSTLAEAHLISGEVKLANGDANGARSEWEIAANSPGPQWVRDRANELLNSLH